MSATHDHDRCAVCHRSAEPDDERRLRLVIPTAGLLTGGLILDDATGTAIAGVDDVEVLMPKGEFRRVVVTLVDCEIEVAPAMGRAA